MFYITLQELYDIFDGIVDEYKATSKYRFIKRYALAQRAFTVTTLIGLLEKRVEDAQEQHYCGPECGAEQN